MNNDNPETYKEKLKLLIIDKLVLGIVAAIVAFFATWLLDQHKMIGDYQKVLFEKRLSSYESIMKLATGIRDKSLFITTAPDLKKDPRTQGDLNISSKIKVADGYLNHNWDSDPVTEWEWVFIDEYKEYNELLNLIKTLDTIRRDQDLYISPQVSAAVERFLNSSLEQVNKACEKSTQIQYDKKTEAGKIITTVVGPKAFHPAKLEVDNVLKTYKELRDLILQSLKVSTVVLG